MYGNPIQPQGLIKQMPSNDQLSRSPFLNPVPFPAQGFPSMQPIQNQGMLQMISSIVESVVSAVLRSVLPMLGMGSCAGPQQMGMPLMNAGAASASSSKEAPSFWDSTKNILGKTWDFFTAEDGGLSKVADVASGLWDKGKNFLGNLADIGGGWISKGAKWLGSLF